jgi:hypothetical protein
MFFFKICFFFLYYYLLLLSTYLFIFNLNPNPHATVRFRVLLLLLLLFKDKQLNPNPPATMRFRVPDFAWWVPDFTCCELPAAKWIENRPRRKIDRTSTDSSRETDQKSIQKHPKWIEHR